LQVADGETTQGAETEAAVSHQTIAAAFEDTEAAHLSALAGAAQAILDHVKAISAVFDEQVGAVGPQLDPLQKIAYDIKRRLGAVVRDESVEDAEDDDAAVPRDETGDSATPATARRGPSGAINSPQDVVAALDRIVDYYARCEPSSPLPLLLKRARRLVSADFVTIMKDMAPQGVENVALIGGLEEPFD
ncbi:MAG: type VI secretion system protein TssA, partial [Pseudomonadota bacterium]